MKIFFRIVKILIILFFSLLLISFLFFEYEFPRVGPPQELSVSVTPERMKRGKYLVEHVTVCLSCHSTRDWSHFEGPIQAGTEGMGGEVFDESLGIPGTLYASNITPAAIGKWTDGDLLRTFTEGVNPKGKALFPLMPYKNYAHLSWDDAQSILVYIRTLKSKEHEVPPSSLKFPMNFIVKTIPTPAQFSDIPENTVEYGRYLANIASCGDCHTQRDRGQPIAGMNFAGGFVFSFPKNITRSANITPDNETGIGLWKKEDFIARFKTYKTHSVGNSDFKTRMPWDEYSGMTENDLGAIYDYLRTLKPIQNKVEHFTATAN